MRIRCFDRLEKKGWKEGMTGQSPEGKGERGVRGAEPESGGPDNAALCAPHGYSSPAAFGPLLNSIPRPGCRWVSGAPRTVCEAAAVRVSRSTAIWGSPSGPVAHRDRRPGARAEGLGQRRGARGWERGRPGLLGSPSSDESCHPSWGRGARTALVRAGLKP